MKHHERQMEKETSSSFKEKEESYEGEEEVNRSNSTQNMTFVSLPILPCDTHSCLRLVFGMPEKTGWIDETYLLLLSVYCFRKRN